MGQIRGILQARRGYPGQGELAVQHRAPLSGVGPDVQREGGQEAQGGVPGKVEGDIRFHRRHGVPEEGPGFHVEHSCFILVLFPKIF